MNNRHIVYILILCAVSSLLFVAISHAQTSGGSSGGSSYSGSGGSGGGGSSGGGSGSGSGGGGDTGSSPFGGSISNITYCTCSGSIMLDINDVSNGDISLVFQFGASMLYPFFNIYENGVNVLGTYTSGGTCMVISGPDCNSEGNPGGTIQMIGTSLYGSSGGGD